MNLIAKAINKKLFVECDDNVVIITKLGLRDKESTVILMRDELKQLVELVNRGELS